jgi:hypothetical protein
MMEIKSNQKIMYFIVGPGEDGKESGSDPESFSWSPEAGEGDESSAEDLAYQRSDEIEDKFPDEAFEGLADPPPERRGGDDWFVSVTPVITDGAIAPNVFQIIASTTVFGEYQEPDSYVIKVTFKESEDGSGFEIQSASYGDELEPTPMSEEQRKEVKSRMEMYLQS